MLNRWIGILAGCAMLLANAAVFWRDVWPNWLAGDPPPSEAETLRPGEERQVQIGIYRAEGGAPVGKSWTRASRKAAGGLVMVLTTTVLEPVVLPGGLSSPRVRVETELTYRNQQACIDELDFRMHGLPVPIHLHGEAMPDGGFPLEWQVGSQRGSVVLDSQAPVTLGDVIRPFDRLPDLYVGRTWKLDLLDPLAQLMPQIRNSGLAPEPVLIQVTGREPLDHNGETLETYVVEGGGARAWVARDGRVLRQEVNVPLLGALVLLEEPYDDDARRAAIAATSGPEGRTHRHTEGRPR